MDDHADDVGQHLAALGAGAIEGQQGSASHVQPLRLAADAEAGFVHMLDRRFGDEVAQRFDKAAQTPRAIPAHGGDRAGGELHAEQIGHQFDEAILGQQLIMQEVDHEGGDPGAILRRRLDVLGKRRPRGRAARLASARKRPVLGDDERLFELFKPEPALQLGNPRLQCHDLRRLRLYQRNQLIPSSARWVIRRSPDFRIGTRVTCREKSAVTKIRINGDKPGQLV